MDVKSFADVDLALKRDAELAVAIEKINGEVTVECNRIKEARKAEIDRLTNEKKYVEQCITSFCEENKAEFAKTRSKDFTFGKVSYRLSKSVTLPRVKAKVEALLNSIKAFGLAKQCITYEEKPNREGLVELEDADLVKLGLTRKVKDNFKIEAKIEALEASA